LFYPRLARIRERRQRDELHGPGRAHPQSDSLTDPQQPQSRRIERGSVKIDDRTVIQKDVTAS
jgi:hypothetical protein